MIPDFRSLSCLPKVVGWAAESLFFDVWEKNQTMTAPRQCVIASWRQTDGADSALGWYRLVGAGLCRKQIPIAGTHASDTSTVAWWFGAFACCLARIGLPAVLATEVDSVGPQVGILELKGRSQRADQRPRSNGITICIKIGDQRAIELAIDLIAGTQYIGPIEQGIAGRHVASVA